MIRSINSQTLLQCGSYLSVSLVAVYQQLKISPSFAEVVTFRWASQMGDFPCKEFIIKYFVQVPQRYAVMICGYCQQASKLNSEINGGPHAEALLSLELVVH